MNIWLIMSGEPLEMFGERPHRIGILSKMLANKGHDVTWWTTTYDHQHKKYFLNQDTKLKNNFGVNMIFLHPSVTYKKNVSFKRLINYKQVSLKFRSISMSESKPDIVLCAFPSIDLAYEAVNYAKNHNIPVVIDIRDLWPDIFLDLVPKRLRGLMSIFLWSLFNKTTYIFKNTYGVSGITNKFLDFGLNYAKRNMSDKDEAFPFGYPKFNLKEDDKQIALEKLKNLNVDFDKFIICYFGTISNQLNFKPILESARILKDENIQFVICGVGDYLEDLKDDIKDIDNIVTPGWLNQNQIWTLMHYAKASLVPYINKNDFLSSLSNKSIEYLSGSLPILSSINGVLGETITMYKCGFVYGMSADKLVKYILLLKNDDSLYREMSSNAINLFNNKFSADIVYNNMIKYLEKIVKIYKENGND